MFEINRLIGKSKSQGSAAVKKDQAKTETSIPMVQLMKKVTAVADTPVDDSSSTIQNPLIQSKNRPVPLFKQFSAADIKEHFNHDGEEEDFQFKKSILNIEDSDDER
jgi:hypothetical protein